MSNYCPRIYHGLSLNNITKTDLTYAACCWAKSVVTGPKLDFDNPDFMFLRAINTQNLLPPDYCAACVNQEQAGAKSMRQGYIELHPLETRQPCLEYLDINVDYTCNLACVTCGPDLSTTWRNELKIKGQDVRPDLAVFLTDQLGSLDLAHLKEIRIWGGEPFLTHTHQRILEYVADRCDPANIRVMYNTNGTQRITTEVKQLLERFKFVRISFSIDGVGEQFEYLRYPARWGDVETTLFWWRDNLPHNSMLSLTVTASLLNVLYLNSVAEWHASHFNKSIFGDEIELYVHEAFGMYALQNMPQDQVEYLKSLTNYAFPWIQSLSNLGATEQNITEIVSTLRALDQRRNVNLATALPLTAQFLNY